MQNKIPINWQKVKLGEVVNFTNGRSIKVTDTGKYLVYGSNGLIGRSDNYNYENGVVVGRVGVYCGSLNYEPYKFWATDNTIVGKFKSGIDNRYLYYLLQTLALNHRAGGSAQPLLTQDVLNIIEINLPLDAKIQSQITSILYAFDDKIELNIKIAKTLEEMAQVLFKEWFIKRDNSNTSRKFIRDVGLVKSGSRPMKISSKRENNMTVPVYGANEIMGYTNDILYDEKVIITGRVGTIGKVFIINEPFWPSDNVLVILPKEKKYTCFLYFLLRRINFTSLNRGSSQPLITQGDLEKCPLPDFDERIVENFHKSVGPFFDKLLIIERENQRLTALCNLLLPKLMNGEIRTD